LVTIPNTVPLMHKDIIFLPSVEESSRQKVLNFVKDWISIDKWLTVQTSGSTGEPKKIQLYKSKMKASANATATFFKFKENQTILLALSTDYIAGKMMIIRALESKMKIIVAPLQANPLLIDLPSKINFSAFVPMQVQTILADKKSKLNYQNIDKVIIGGGLINETLEHQIQTLKNENFATFGMTETISHIALRNITKKEKHYTALPNVTLKTDHNNSLIINAPQICNHLLKTNDCIELKNDRQFIWKGRLDFVINSGGVKVHPENIEKKILPFIPNNRFYVSSERDNLLGQKVVLKIESRTDFNIENLNIKLNQNLTKFEQPKVIYIVHQFKETETGKIIRE